MIIGVVPVVRFTKTEGLETFEVLILRVAKLVVFPLLVKPGEVQH